MQRTPLPDSQGMYTDTISHITLKGAMKFSYSFSKNVVDLVPTGYKKRYIILYDNGSEVIKLKHVSEKEKE